MSPRHTWGPLAVVGALVLTPAFADDGPQPPAPSAQTWTVGALTQSELTLVTRGAEHSSLDDAAFSTQRELKLSYVDRVEALTGDRITTITRHFLRARVVEEGGPEQTLPLEGRQAKLVRDSEGRVRATWADGSRLELRERIAATEGPWPDVDQSWALGRGTRQGQVQRVSIMDFAAGPEVPSFVTDAVRSFPFEQVQQGSWSLTVTGDFRPAGKAEGKLELTGRETQGEEELRIEQTVQLTLVRKAPTAKALPAPAPRAPAAEEGWDDPDLGDLDEGEGYGDDMDDEDMGDEDDDDE